MKIWNITRTLAQIKEHMYGPLLSIDKNALLAYYTFNQETGTSLIDSSGNDRHGILKNMDTEINRESILSPRQFAAYGLRNDLKTTTQNAFSFNGNEYVDLGKDNLKPTDELTLEFWIKDDWSNNETIIGNTENSGYAIYYQDNQLHFAIYTHNNGGQTLYYDIDSDQFSSEWHHIAATFDGQYMRLYIDGEQKNSKPLEEIDSINYSTSTKTLVGAETDGYGNPQEGFYFNGKIYELKIWNIARTPPQIQEHMYCPLLSIDKDALLAYYTFNQETGTRLLDSSGNNRHGTLVNVLSFNAADEYIDLGQVDLKPTEALTLEFWLLVPYNKFSASNGTIVGNTEGSGYEIFIEGDQLRFLICTENGYEYVNYLKSEFSPGWHHIAATFDGQYIRLYVDGEEKGNRDLGGNHLIHHSVTTKTLIGAETDAIGDPTDGWYFEGKIRELRIWNIPRTSVQIREYMYQPLFSENDPSLLAYYTYIIDNKLYDISDKNHHGTLKMMDTDIDWVSSDKMVAPAWTGESDIYDIYQLVKVKLAFYYYNLCVFKYFIVWITNLYLKQFKLS